MKKDIKDITASVRARLLRIAKESNSDFNAVIIHYFQERFLYRLSISGHKDNFILKGGQLFRIYNMPDARPTKDIDFLGNNIAHDKDNLLQLIAEIISQETSDGVWFDPESLKAVTINQEANYSGVRIFCLAYLGQAKIRLHFDIGFGDEIVPKAKQMVFPVLLSDMPKPELIVYSPESLVAEKLEIIVKLGFSTSRMKDFYDIYYLANHYNFSSEKLIKAIETTFNNRKTKLDDKKIIFSQEFTNDPTNLTQWNTFISRLKLKIGLSFQDCINVIEKFIEPLFNCQNNRIWNTKDFFWK